MSFSLGDVTIVIFNKKLLVDYKSPLRSFGRTDRI